MRLLLSAWLVALLAAAACSAPPGDPADSRGEPALAVAGADGEIATSTLQPDDVVDLTVYLRAGEGPHAHLEPVTREASVDDDLPRRSLELLLAGPVEGESTLDPAWPPTTQVRRLEVRGGTAYVELSPEAIRDASTVGDSPANEALALGAIANTLTEFPSVERVELEVTGQNIRSSEFWGGWGLPPVLVRDETLVGVSEGGGVPELERFSSEPQSTGSDDATGAQLVSLRVRDRLTHVRFVMELADPDAPGSDPKVPRVRARGRNDVIVLEFMGVAPGPDLVAGRVLDLSDPSFRLLEMEQQGPRTTLRLTVDGARERRFWLHSRTGPTRIVLDVKK